MKRARWFLLATFFVAIAAAWWRDAEADGLTLISRSQVAPGVELVVATLTVEDRRSEVVVLYCEPQRIHPEILLNEALSPLTTLAPHAAVVVNAGYFTAERRPTGLLVSHGKVLHPLVPKGGSAGSGVLVVDDEVRLLTRDEAKTHRFDEALLAIQSGPRIVEPDGSYGIRSDDGARANRTVIGKDVGGRLALAVFHAPHGAGPTLFELQRWLTEGLGALAPELRFQTALNLDGGPSTGMVLRFPKHERRLPEGVAVHSVLALKVEP